MDNMQREAAIIKIAGIKIIEFVAAHSIAKAHTEHGGTPEGKVAALAGAKSMMDSMAAALTGDALGIIGDKYEEACAALDADNPEAKAAREARDIISRFTLR